MASAKWVGIVAIVVLSGCGRATPTSSSMAKATNRADTTGSSASKKGEGSESGIRGDSAAGASGPMAASGFTLIPREDPRQKAAEAFLAALSQASGKTGSFPPELTKQVSVPFLKVIGKPLLADDDKKRGYSVAAAEGWLRRAGAALRGIGTSQGFGSSTSAVFVGTGLAGGPDHFLLRLALVEGNWKLDWFEIGTAKVEGTQPAFQENPYRTFIALAFLDALTGTTGSKEDRTLLLGALISLGLKTTWAEPFQGDMARGYDFNPTKLAMKARELGEGVTQLTIVPAGENAYKVELTKGVGKKARVLKLAEGKGSNGWLVEQFH